MRRFSIWIFVILSAIAYFYFGLRYGLIGLRFIGITITDAQTVVETLQSFIETMAIIVAGVWTYERFIKAREDSREDYPYPRIQHRIEHYALENDTIYLSVFVTVTNEGKTKLDLDLAGGKIFIRQVSPLSEEIKKYIDEALENLRDENIRRGKVQGLFIDQGQRLGWVTLGSRDLRQFRQKNTIKELEPGQTREIQFDFLLLENDVKVIEAISYFEYAESSWELATLYSLETRHTKVVSHSES